MVRVALGVGRGLLSRLQVARHLRAWSSTTGILAIVAMSARSAGLGCRSMVTMLRRFWLK